MTRLLFHLIFLILPVLVFYIYVVVAVRYREETGQPFHRSGFYWSWLAGLMLFIASFFLWSAFSPRYDDGQYVPPYWDGEKVVPGRVVPDNDNGAEADGEP